MLQTPTLSQAIESMVEHVRTNLKLQDRKEDQSRSVITITGRGISCEALDVPFAIDVVTKINRALPINHFNRTIEERSSSTIGEKAFTGILFPRSIDYAAEVAELHTPYLKQAKLIPEWMNPELKARYARFQRYDVKDLSRIEWKVALPLGGYRIAYYNPLHDTVEVCTIMKFGRGEIIPDNRPREERAGQEGYFWDFIELGRFPSNENKSRKAEVFRGIQKGLHDRVRKIVRTETIPGQFTMRNYGSAGARFEKYQQK